MGTLDGCFLLEALDLNIHAAKGLVLGYLAGALERGVGIDGASDGREHEVVAGAKGLVEVVLHFIGL